MATLRPVREVDAAEDRGHAAACGHAFDLVMVELVAGMDGCHFGLDQSSSQLAANPRSAQLVGPSPVHPHSFHAADTDHLQADIIAAVSLLGNRHQLVSCSIQVGSMARHRRDFRSFHRAM